MKKTILSIAIVTGMAIMLSNYTQAQAFSFADLSAKRQSFFEFLANKFKLNKNDVETAITDYRNTRMQEEQTERQEDITTKLDALVKNGKITEDQKNRILEKVKEWQEQRGDWQNLTREERFAKIQTHRDDMIKWAKDNGIDTSYLPEFVLDMGPGRNGGNGGGMGRNRF